MFWFLSFPGSKEEKQIHRRKKVVRDQEGLEMVELSGIGLIGWERGRFLNWGCSLIFDCGICTTVSLYVGHSYYQFCNSYSLVLHQIKVKARW